MTTTNLYQFQNIKHVYKLRRIADDSWWIYLYKIGIHGQLCPTPRIVFFGHSREQAESWLENLEQQAFVISEPT